VSCAVPAGGEMVFSVFCRNWERSGIRQAQIVETLTGQPCITSLLGGVPGYLQTISRSVPAGHPWTDPRITISRNTLFPYLTYFDTPSVRNKVADILQRQELGPSVRMTLGLCAYRCGLLPRRPRVCPECILADDFAGGFPYFHREHQAPGVAVCWLHGSVLAHGCVVCGPYPLRGRSLSMAGRCFCSGTMTPLPAYSQLPENRVVLQWIANESAYMISVEETRVASVREALRSLAMKNGHHVGKSVSYLKLAEAMENRFGADVLNWLGYPAWTDHKPSAWVRRSLPRQEENRRKPTLVILLLVGLLADSVKKFEDIANQTLLESSEAHEATLRETSYPGRVGARTKSCNEYPQLSEVLVANQYCLSAAAEQLHLSLDQLRRQALIQKIRVPLSPQTSSRLDSAKLASICADLESGHPQKHVRKAHGISSCALIRVQLNSPGLYQAHRDASALRVRELHRRRILQQLATNSAATRNSICTSVPGSYDYALRADKEWFHASVPRQERSPIGSRRYSPDWKEVDIKIAPQVQKAIDQLHSLSRPVQISKSAILKRAMVPQKFTQMPELFPIVDGILRRNIESHTEFLRRKIKWAIEEMAKVGVPLSVNTLRRKAGIPPKELRTYKQVVIRAAMHAGAEIQCRSFFSS
jgi:hypothetical protein